MKFIFLSLDISSDELSIKLFSNVENRVKNCRKNLFQKENEMIFYEFIYRFFSFLLFLSSFKDFFINVENVILLNAYYNSV